MKKIVFTLLCFAICLGSRAQVFSYKKINDGIRQGELNETTRIRQQLAVSNIPGSILTYKRIIRNLENETEDSIESFKRKRLYVLQTASFINKNDTIKALNKFLDSFVDNRLKLIAEVKHWGIIEDYRGRRFFPAYFSSQAIDFFEGDTTHQKLFQNNLVNYNPKSKKMTLYTEAVNDYLGPLRVGIGFQISSKATQDSLSTKDSTVKLEKKADLVSALQNGGGDISVNFQIPFIKTNNTLALIQSRFYLYANTGFSLPVLNKANDDFLFNYSMGMEGAFYARGFNNKLTFFSQLKAGYYNGNKNYKTVIKNANTEDPTSFGLIQSSFGIDFLGGYRIKVDLFNGNDFIRKNFPTTVTFIVKPIKNADN